MCSNSTSFGASSAPNSILAGCGSPCAARPVRSSPTLGAVRPMRPMPCVNASRRMIVAAPPAATAGWPTRKFFPSAPIVSAAKGRAKLAMSSVGTALCASGWAALFAKRSPSPSATGCTNWRCACSFITTICPLTRCRYLRLNSPACTLGHPALGSEIDVLDFVWRTFSHRVVI